MSKLLYCKECQWALEVDVSAGLKDEWCPHVIESSIVRNRLRKVEVEGLKNSEKKT